MPKEMFSPFLSHIYKHCYTLSIKGISKVHGMPPMEEVCINV